MIVLCLSISSDIRSEQIGTPTTGHFAVLLYSWFLIIVSFCRQAYRTISWLTTRQVTPSYRPPRIPPSALSTITARRMGLTLGSLAEAQKTVSTTVNHRSHPLLYQTFSIQNSGTTLPSRRQRSPFLLRPQQTSLPSAASELSFQLVAVKHLAQHGEIVLRLKSELGRVRGNHPHQKRARCSKGFGFCWNRTRPAASWGRTR